MALEEFKKVIYHVLVSLNDFEVCKTICGYFSAETSSIGDHIYNFCGRVVVE